MRQTVCGLRRLGGFGITAAALFALAAAFLAACDSGVSGVVDGDERSEEHTSELQSLTAISYAVFCLRSEERRVGKECLRLCRSRWSPYH